MDKFDNNCEMIKMVGKMVKRRSSDAATALIYTWAPTTNNKTKNTKILLFEKKMGIGGRFQDLPLLPSFS